jgi:integrase
MAKRIKTSYPGIFYREAKRLGSPGKERVYYIVFKKDAKVYEEKVGRQYVDAMTPARAARIRAERIEGRRKSRKELREEEEAKRRGEVHRWTIDKLWQEYMAQKPISNSLRTDENRYEKHLKPVFGKKEPTELLRFDIDRVRIRLLKKRSPQTVKHILALLKRIINFGVNRGLCSGLDFKIDMPRVHNLKTEDLSTEQLSQLVEAIDQDHDIQAANIMRIALFTGLRRGELFKLKWGDIDFERGFIHVRDPKGGPDQVIPLNEGAKHVLENHPRGDSPFIFPGRGGGQRVDVKKAVNRIKRRAGLPKDFRPLHGLRHFYASMLASSGKVDMYTLQKLLTHKSPQMTQRYAHLRDEALRKASNLASDLISQNIDGRSKVNQPQEYEK